MFTEQPPGWLAGKPEYLPKAEDHGGVGKNKKREEHDGRFRFWESSMTKSRRNEKASFLRNLEQKVTTVTGIKLWIRV